MLSRIMKTVLELLLVAILTTVYGCSDQAQRDAAGLDAGNNAYAKGDFSAAMEKFKPVAEHGNDSAQFRLGLMYREGQGVVKDEKAAVSWFEKSAEQGNVEAQENLGLSYAKGQGVDRDWVQADKWFSIAAASGKETAVNNKKVVEVHMPPEKVAEANKLAQEWLDKHKK